MTLKEIIHFIDKRDGLQTFIVVFLGFSVFFIICGIGIYYEKSDERNEKEMIEIANKCKSDALSYNFVSAHEKLNILANDRDASIDLYIDGVDYYKIKKKRYEETEDYVFNAEAMYLCSKGDKESIDRITFLLSSIPVKGIAIPEGTEYEYETEFIGEIGENHSDYINYVTAFNQKCETLIDLAISNRCFSLVEKVLPLIKSVPDIPSTVYKNGKNIRHKLTYNDNTKKQAILKVNKAIRESVFPGVNKEINI